MKKLAGFDLFDVSDEPAQKKSESARAMEELKRGDVVTVGRTRWVVMRSIGSHQAWVYKHPSKHVKLYEVRIEGLDADSATVHQVGGSGQRVGDDVASGPLRPTGEKVASMVRNPGAAKRRLMR